VPLALFIYYVNAYLKQSFNFYIGLFRFIYYIIL